MYANLDQLGIGNKIYTKHSREKQACINRSTNHNGATKACTIYFIQEFENALASFVSKDFTTRAKSYTSMSLCAFSDAAWAFDAEDRWPTSDACLFLGQNLISWRSKKYTHVACSRAKA